jgi:myo-inositol 2-dehydrogenase/D-chiro-inositol 1-dehydrogenase
MSVRVGIVGAGNIGEDHAHRLAERTRGAEVAAIADVDAARAEAVAHAVGAQACPTDQLVGRDDVDAVVVTTTGAHHEPYVLAAIAARKPVFCEKPLATTAAACQRIVEAEAAAGRRLVQVGFMRRFDPDYIAVREAIADGRIGRPLIVHCVHRNAASGPGLTSASIVLDSAVHEIDQVRWLLGEEVATARVLAPRPTSRVEAGVYDPMVVVLEMASGAMVLDELFVNAGYGYDVRCEVVGETGAVALPDPGAVVVRQNGHRGRAVPLDWRERFRAAYDAELRAWVDAVAAGNGGTGPTAHDGLAATAVAEACLRAIESGQRAPVQLPFTGTST